MEFLMHANSYSDHGVLGLVKVQIPHSVCVCVVCVVPATFFLPAKLTQQKSDVQETEHRH